MFPYDCESVSYRIHFFGEVVKGFPNLFFYIICAQKKVFTLANGLND